MAYLIHTPAFPVMPGADYQGLSHVMFMAAHAPKVIPAWFTPEIDIECPKEMTPIYLVFGKNSDHPYKDLFEEWYMDGHDNPPVPKEVLREWDEYLAQDKSRDLEIKDWKDMYERERVFQWPIFWANGVIDKHP